MNISFAFQVQLAVTGEAYHGCYNVRFTDGREPSPEDSLPLATPHPLQGVCHDFKADVLPCRYSPRLTASGWDKAQHGFLCSPAAQKARLLRAAGFSRSLHSTAHPDHHDDDDPSSKLLMLCWGNGLSLKTFVWERYRQSISARSTGVGMRGRLKSGAYTFAVTVKPENKVVTALGLRLKMPADMCLQA